MNVAENRGEFLEKLQRARSQVKGNMPSKPILSSPSATKIQVGNWTLSSKKEGELLVHNADGLQVRLYLFYVLALTVE